MTDTEIDGAAHVERLLNTGDLIESGFRAFCDTFVANDVCPMMIQALRMAYVAGVDYAFCSTVHAANGDDETRVTQRLEKMRVEVTAARSWLELTSSPPAGSA